jgi:class 3 adenylate cyclase/tetratricopeptide (TPR) repeat protein
MKCPACGFENRETARFCGECTAPLSQEIACPRCGTLNPSRQRFCDACAHALAGRAVPEISRGPHSYTPKHLAERILAEQAALEARGASEGERKTITALFADIKGSMELLEDLDPEDARRLIDPALEIMMDAVHRYEGYVAQSTGDGIFALFGAPIAHEDHPRRACYAALKMQEEMRRYAEQVRREKGVNLQARVGLNTGEVVLRSIRTDDLHTDYVPIGHSTSLAARMESLATPGSIVVSEHTHKLIEGYFQLKALGEAKVKGVSEPLRIYEVAGVGPLRTRMEVSVRRGLVRFVGRQDEMEQLRRAWESAKGGHGQIVAVMGEAGVGKSRLFYEFKVPVQAQCLVLEAFSVSHGKAHAYLPLIDLLKSYFRIGLEDDERRRQEKINGKVLTLDRKLEDTLPYLFSLLGVTDPTSSLAQMDAQIRRQRTMEAVKRVLVRETLNQPMVVIFEDLHWIDGETQAFLEMLSDAVATARLLLLVNYRPEYRHGWGSKTYYTQLRLDPLGKKEAAELLQVLLGNGAQTGIESLKRVMLEKTEGNPFFMEEVVRGLWEEGVLTGERGRYRLEKAATELHIPATVQGVLAARIDRLPANEKEFLQTLSVIGKEFSFGLLRKVTGHAEGELYHLLSHVQAGEFIYEQPAFPEPEYTFKHALTQEVAYQSVLVERRKLLHERTAQAIEDLHPYGLDEHYAELARHYARSDNVAKAVEYLHLAGQQAVDRSAYEEGIRQLTKGLELLQTQPEGAQRTQQEVLIQTAIGPALSATKGWLSAEAEEAYRRVRELCDRLGETAQLFPGLAGLAASCLTRGRLYQAQELGERLLRVTHSAHDPVLLCLPHACLGETLFWLGEFSQAHAHCEQGIAIYDPKKSRYLRSMFVATDPGVYCLSYISWILLRLGYFDQALERSQEAVRLAQEISHSYSQCSALTFSGFVQLWSGKPQGAHERAAAAITLANENGFPDWLMWADFLQANALAEQDERREDGAVQMSQMVDVLQAIGVRVGLPVVLVGVAETQGKLGQTEQALSRVAEAFNLSKTTAERAAEADLYRVKGELLLALSKEDQAENCFHQAIDVARRQSAKSYELRAAMSLTRLWQKQGKKEEARRMLAEIYGWFTEGFDTRDLKEAKALLEEPGG